MLTLNIIMARCQRASVQISAEYVQTKGNAANLASFVLLMYNVVIQILVTAAAMLCTLNAVMSKVQDWLVD